MYEVTAAVTGTNNITGKLTRKVHANSNDHACEVMASYCDDHKHVDTYIIESAKKI